jgi:hypothetical protein
MIDNQAAHTAVRNVLRHHKLTKNGDSVVEADLIAAVLSACNTEVPARHPVVVKWRNDGITACAGIADAYGSHQAAQDMRAMLTKEPVDPAALSAVDQMILTAGAQSGNLGAMSLAAQLVGVPACGQCFYVKTHCQCLSQESTAPPEDRGTV